MSKKMIRLAVVLGFFLSAGALQLRADGPLPVPLPNPPSQSR
jgi:hypothetical protein